MQQAEARGLRPEIGNPCKGIRRYRQKRCERFLSPEEYRRLGMVLDRHEDRQPFRVAALRLLLLTGCRKSEIVTLEWRFYRDGRLYLADSKTGRRTVWLCGAGNPGWSAAVFAFRVPHRRLAHAVELAGRLLDTVARRGGP